MRRAFIKRVKECIHERCEITYLLARVNSDDEAGQGLLHKLGGMEVRREENSYAVLLQQLKTTYGEDLEERYGDQVRRLQEMAGRSYVGVYRLD